MQRDFYDFWYRTKQWSRLYWEWILAAGIFTTCQPSGAGLPPPLCHLCEQLEFDCARTKVLASFFSSMLKPWGHTRGCCYFGPSILNYFEFSLDGIFHFNFSAQKFHSCLPWLGHVTCDLIRLGNAEVMKLRDEDYMMLGRMVCSHM